MSPMTSEDSLCIITSLQKTVRLLICTFLRWRCLPYTNIRKKRNCVLVMFHLFAGESVYRLLHFYFTASHDYCSAALYTSLDVGRNVLMINATVLKVKNILTQLPYLPRQQDVHFTSSRLYLQVLFFCRLFGKAR